MRVIAKALVLASNYIAERGQDHTEDDDVNQLEELAHLLKSATLTEIDSLVSAAHELELRKWPDEMGLI